MKTIKHFLLGFILLLSVNVAFSQTADDIINKYITAIGGADNWRKVKSMKVTGRLEIQTVKIPFTQQGIQNIGVRIEGEFQGQKFIDITTPTKGWSQNPFAGKTTMQPITEEELKDKLDELDLQDHFIDYAAKGSSVEFLGKEEEDGNEYYKIRLTTKNGKESVYFFDINTFLAYKTEQTSKQQGQEVKVTAKLLDYKTLPSGIKMPHKTQDNLGQTFVIEVIEVNATIDESIFVGK